MAKSFLDFIPNYNIQSINNCEDYKSENDKLKLECDKLKNYVQILKTEIEKLKKENVISQTKSKNEIENLRNEINNLKSALIEKNNEIKNLYSQINDLVTNNNFDKCKDEINEIISIQFKSKDEDLDVSFLCKKKDLFSKIEEKLFNQYPEYKDFNIYFTVNGVIVKRHKTIEENNIKNSDKILLNIYQ